MLDAAGYGVCRSTVEGKLLYVNSALARMLRYDVPRELMGVDLSRDVYRDELEWTRFLELCRGGDRIERVEVEWKRKDGKPVTVSLSGRVVRGASGAPEGHEVIVEDVTERRSLEAQLVQAQKMEAVGRLAGGAAHDFNNLLNAINGYSSVLESRLASDDPLRHYVRGIRETGERCAALTSQLLAFARREVWQPSVIDLNAAIQETAGLLRRLVGEEIEVELSLDPSPGYVETDSTHVSQILMNLAVNARDAMPSGGKLRIETEDAVLDDGNARQHPGVLPGRYAIVSVSDTGCGMDEATRTRIFEPFFTTKPSGTGTGLGLSTVYGIVKQAGGSIRVHSEEEKGTSFVIYLPRVEPTAPAPRWLAPRLETMPRGTETIVVVEDEATVRELVVETLVGHGYQVLEAPHPAEAVLRCQRYEGDIDLLITDVVIPHMSGADLAERVAELRPGIRVLYVSSYGEDKLPGRPRPGPRADVLEKPFTLTDLLQAVRAALDGPGRDETARVD